MGLGERVFLFCSQLRCSPEDLQAKVAALESELDACQLAPAEVEKLRKMVLQHAARLGSAPR